MSLDRRRNPLVLLAFAVLALPACDGGESTTSGTTTTSGSGGSSTTTSGSGGNGGSGGSSSASGGSATSGSGGSGGTTTSSGGSASGGSGGAPSECDMLAAGPLTPVVVFAAFNGSEDIAFDGKGHIAGKKQTNVLLADSSGQTTTAASDVPTAYGLRYRPDGFLVVALPNDNKVIEISPAGVSSDVVTGLGGPNGLYPDFDGNVWMTEIGANKVSRINPDKSVDVIVSGAKASGANGVVLDASRQMLYYTNYSQGRVRRVDMAPGADPAPIDVIQIPNAALDGMVMDACGHLYVLDQGSSKMFRVKLDAAGDAAGPEELMATFPKNVANAQFGSGPGFDPKMLYVAGNPGTVYSLAVGVAGAPVPTPP